MIAGVVSGKAALVVAHPGHELCVYGWLEQARPRVFVLTDGSGRSGIPRLQSTTKILARHGAIPEGGRAGDIRLTLGDAQLSRKLSLAREYPELRDEVDALLDGKALE